MTRRFARLLALLPDLEARASSPPSLDDLAGRLYTAAHEDGSIFKFDWASYAQGARHYFEPGNVESADLDTCRKLLTIIVRQDRFVEGSLRAHVESGFATRVVRRIGELTSPPACPACSSADVLPIVYGEPEPDVRGTMLAPRPGDEVALGGCMVSPEAPAWRCRACRHDFGRLDERAPGMFSSEGEDHV